MPVVNEKGDDYYRKLTLRNNLEERIPKLRNEMAHGLSAVLDGKSNSLMHGIPVPHDLAALMTLSKNEIAAMRLAAGNGRVTTKELADKRGVTTRIASTVLKGLANRDLLTWCGRNPCNPQQYYEITTKKFGVIS